MKYAERIELFKGDFSKNLFCSTGITNACLFSETPLQIWHMMCISVSIFFGNFLWYT